jgi:hypothetical protein
MSCCDSQKARHRQRISRRAVAAHPARCWTHTQFHVESEFVCRGRNNKAIMILFVVIRRNLFVVILFVGDIICCDIICCDPKIVMRRKTLAILTSVNASLFCSFAKYAESLLASKMTWLILARSIPSMPALALVK